MAVFGKWLNMVDMGGISDDLEVISAGLGEEEHKRKRRFRAMEKWQVPFAPREMETPINGWPTDNQECGSDTKKEICKFINRLLEIIGMSNVNIYFQNIV